MYGGGGGSRTGLGFWPLAHDSRILARFCRCAAAPPNRPPLMREIWPSFRPRCVEPTGRRREPEAAGTGPAASTASKAAAGIVPAASEDRGGRGGRGNPCPIGYPMTVIAGER